ncbi:unnamed protein product [Caenorhabditis sp. 36 PRJEB53466]|nr:unnamed protein product [Caenorhabditis sp. 36 PRJEB53466]
MPGLNFRNENVQKTNGQSQKRRRQRRAARREQENSPPTETTQTPQPPREDESLTADSSTSTDDSSTSTADSSTSTADSSTSTADSSTSTDDSGLGSFSFKPALESTYLNITGTAISEIPARPSASSSSSWDSAVDQMLLDIFCTDVVITGSRSRRISPAESMCTEACGLRRDAEKATNNWLLNVVLEGNTPTAAPPSPNALPVPVVPQLVLPPSPPQRRPRCCSFCYGTALARWRQNGEPIQSRDSEGPWSSHSLKENGRTTCPVMRRNPCRICGASGDIAHTTQYHLQHLPMSSNFDFVE